MVGGKKRKNRVVSLILREGSTLSVVVGVVDVYNCHKWRYGDRGRGETERQRDREKGKGGHTTRTRSPILLVDGACSLLVGVVL